MSYVTLAVYGVLALLLIAGGILLLKRKRLSSPLLQTWAVLKILGGGFLMFRMVALTRLQMSILMEPTMNTASKGTAGAADMEMFREITGWATWIGMGLGFLWLAILPVFFIIWFNRHKVVDQIKAW